MKRTDVVFVAAAQEVFATRQRLGEDVIGYAHAIKTRALARLGELLKDLEKAKGAIGAAGPGRGKRGTKQAPRFGGPPTLPDLGISKKEAHIAQRLADLDPATREAIAQRETTFAAARREHKAAAIRKRITLPSAKYRVVGRYAVVVKR